MRLPDPASGTISALAMVAAFGLVVYLLYRVMRWARGRTRGAYVLGAVLSEVTQGLAVYEAKQGKKREEGDERRVATQPIPTVGREDVERILSRDFSAESRRGALAILAEYGSEDSHRESDRVRLAALKLAGGDIDRLRAAIETAKLDYRDVLAGAEYPGYARLVNPSARLTPDERQRIIDADWKQYSEWLAR